MVDYFFTTQKPETSVYAEMDQIGGAICFYLSEFNIDNILPDIYPVNGDDIIADLFCAVAVHEDIHSEIAKEVSTTGDQEHSTVYEMIDNALKA